MVVHSNGRECVGSAGDGEMGRWGDGEMGRWGDGGMGSAGEIKKDISSPLPCRTTDYTKEKYQLDRTYIRGISRVC
ncbi:MAG: hypothetical protein F6K24_25050 [Okeania sp. SIO2D1]|nr:hypothetical protein [Okeania sp. SIO2D1]